MKLSWMKTLTGFLLAVLLSVPAWGDTRGANSALPGTLNYVEGQVSMGAETLNSKSIGSAQLQTGQALTTDSGKAEILLTPGVFLRLDDHSSATLISPNLTDTQVEITKGRAMIEVAQLYKANDIRVLQNGSIAQLLKPGLYDFDAGQNQVRVLDGEALVRDGDHQMKLKSGREVSLDNGAPFKARKFDKKGLEASDLYRFSSLRSSYLAEANVDVARGYVSGYGYGPGWYGAGWYWNPWFSAYTFIPGTESSTARLAMDSTHRCGRIGLLITGADIITVGTVRVIGLLRLPGLGQLGGLRLCALRKGEEASEAAALAVSRDAGKQD